MSETVQPLVDALFPYIGYLIPLPIIIPAVAAALALIFGTLILVWNNFK